MFGHKEVVGRGPTEVIGGTGQGHRLVVLTCVPFVNLEVLSVDQNNTPQLMPARFDLRTRHSKMGTHIMLPLVVSPEWH